MKYLDIVFDGPPGPDAGRFVEVEDDHRHSICIGTWEQRDDGYWVLRVTATDALVLEPPPARRLRRSQAPWICAVLTVWAVAFAIAYVLYPDTVWPPGRHHSTDQQLLDLDRRMD